jgi:hypothetical protein
LEHKDEKGNGLFYSLYLNIIIKEYRGITSLVHICQPHFFLVISRIFLTKLLLMRATYLTTILLLISVMAFTQPVDHKMSEAEKALMPQYLENIVSRGIVTPPDFPVRSAAEWEEMQGIVISWQSFSSVLTEIVRHGVGAGKSLYSYAKFFICSINIDQRQYIYG